MTNDSCWPDPERPGEPQDTLKDWWHAFLFESGEIYCFRWRPDHRWHLEGDTWSPEMMVKSGAKYLGPCVTQIEVKLAWENKLEGIAQFLEDLVWGRSIKEHEQEAFLHAAQIVRKAKETTND